MHSVTDRQTDGQQDDANSRSSAAATAAASLPPRGDFGDDDHIEVFTMFTRDWVIYM